VETSHHLIKLHKLEIFWSEFVLTPILQYAVRKMARTPTDVCLSVTYTDVFLYNALERITDL